MKAASASSAHDCAKLFFIQFRTTDFSGAIGLRIFIFCCYDSKGAMSL
ncbi:hypothetical protein [Francisella sp. SYW-9]|nr:hypothetical protein [Francisella sp. SYW-9]